MANQYKLTYFPVEALAEPIRFLFSYGEIKFEDNRFDREIWPELKPEMPFGQVPVLEYNGKLYNQSLAIARYVAKEVKLAGKNNLEDLEIDSIVDSVNDFRQKLALFHYESDEKVKESKKGVLFKDTIPYFLSRFDSIVKKNDGHLALGRLTWADLYFISLLKYMNFMAKTDLIETYPNLVNLKEKIHAIPAIKKWVETRPKTDM